MKYNFNGKIYFWNLPDITYQLHVEGEEEEMRDLSPNILRGPAYSLYNEGHQIESSLIMAGPSGIGQRARENAEMAIPIPEQDGVSEGGDTFKSVSLDGQSFDFDEMATKKSKFRSALTCHANLAMLLKNRKQ